MNAYSISGNANVAGTGNASYHPSGIYSTGTNWLYGTILTNGSNIGSTSQYVGSVYSNNWFRSSGSTGWYSETYGGGIYMIDTTWVRTYNGKSFYVGGGQIHNSKTANGSYDGATYYAHGNGGNVGIGFYHGVATQIILGWNDTTFYFRNSNNTGWTGVAGIIYNYSSREYKQDITNFPQVVRSVGAAANPLESPALDIVDRLQPRFYRWDYDKNMDAVPSDERRRKALGRLNAYRKEKGFGPWVSDETIHRCGRDCDGTDEQPCNRYKDWENGRLGFIAEEVGEVLPQAARYDMDGKYSALDAVALVSLCVAAIKELKQQLEEVRGTAAAAG
ncbi:MAG: shufflon system plasmid conjugative transfer pilus tip adhesin PilV [Flavobacteriia bacterium]|nr:shufflon system plasmid conjugative transfer pilus tip adhesin PilV [Flavobacteriia bacterium]